MFKKCNYLLWALAAGLCCWSGSSFAAGTMSLTLDSMSDSANIQKYARLQFLPDYQSSDNLGKNPNLVSPDGRNSCKGYTKSGKCPNNQDAAEFCPFDRSKYKTCYCNGKIYPYSADNCYKTSGAANTKGASLLTGKSCKQDSGGTFGEDCSCTTSAYPYTNDASCGDSKKVVNTAEGCVINGTQRYQACKCKDEYDKDATWTSKNGYTCTPCSDSNGTKYKCVAKTCPSGETTTQTTCSGMQQWKGTQNYSGDQQCGKCTDISNCGHYWNGNGAHTIPDSACSWDTYGHTATITVPSGKSYSSAWIRMWGDSTVNGDFTTAVLTPGMVISNGGAYTSKRTITYKGLVTVTDKLRLEPGVTTVKFEKGVCGDFTCEAVKAENGANKYSVLKSGIAQGETYQGVTCPKKSSSCPTTGCSRYFINSDGNITIPNGKCGWDAYGHTANVTTGTPKDNGTYEVSWIRMWGNSTVTNAFKTKELISGLVVSNGGYYKDKRTYTYKGKVTVNGLIKTDPDITTSVFAGGIDGDFRCESWTGTGGNGSKKVADIQPGQPGCPCSQSKFKYTASNCNGVLSGTACSSSYTDCSTIDKCATYNAARTACATCVSGYTLSDGKCVEAKTNAQKCLDEGYRLKADWPKPTAANDTVIPSSMLANFMKRVSAVKSAMAATLTNKIDDDLISNPCEGAMCAVIDQPVTVTPGDKYELIEGDAVLVGDYTFTVTATCPYDSNYVKGEWKYTGLSALDCSVANCKTCASSSTCSVCNIGYTLSSDKKSCTKTTTTTCSVANCKTCVSGSSSTCSLCNPGYTLSNGLCISSTNCITQFCNGIEYCCPSGVSCSDQSGTKCFMKATDQLAATD